MLRGYDVAYTLRSERRARVFMESSTLANLSVACGRVRYLIKLWIQGRDRLYNR